MRPSPFRSKARSIISKTPTAPEINPNDPGSPGYKERHRTTETTMLNGMLRVDVGEPIT